MTMFIYAVKVVLCSGLLFGYYCLLLRNKTFHPFNRYYLLASTIIALVLPLISIPLSLWTIPDKSLLKTLGVISLSGWEDEFIITARTTLLAPTVSMTTIFLCIYLTGLTFSILPLIKFILFIKRLSRRYKGHVEVFDDFTFYDTVEPGTPFSFFRAIYWNNNISLESQKGQHILRHELYHVQQKHTYDLIFMECITSFFWFNPFYRWIKTELQTIHEFLADRFASTGTDKYLYAEWIVSQAIQRRQSSISNQFFHNQIKRRITMITKHGTGRYHHLTRVMALPMLFVVFCAFTLSTNRHPGIGFLEKLVRSDTLPAIELLKSKIEENARFNMYTTKDLAVFKFENGDSLIVKTDDLKALYEKMKNEKAPEYDRIFTRLEVEATYPGGPQAWMTYLNKTFHYPEDAIAKGVQGTVVVQFIVDKEGNISNVEALSGPSTGGLREEAIRVITHSGKWVPGKQNGLAVKSYKKQPMTFRLEK